MRIVFAGTPAIAVPAFESLVQSHHEVCLAVTREDAPVGRKRILTASHVAQAAKAHHVPVLKTNRLDESALNRISSAQPDLGVVVAFGALLPEEALVIPRLGWINIHFSSLPRWRGAAPAQHTLIAGDEVAGVTIFQLDQGLDSGPIFAQREFSIRNGIHAGELLEQLARESIPLLGEVISELEHGTARAVPQQGEVTLAPKLSRADARLDFSLYAEAILRRWAGVTPEPGAWVNVDGKSVKILALQPSGAGFTSDGLLPGECRLIQGHALVGTGSNSLELITVQPEGKLPMRASDWLRGMPSGRQLR